MAKCMHGDDHYRPCLQNSRAPTPPPSSSQEVGRVTRGKSKPALAAVANKKRKLGNHSSNSESQGTPPDSNFSKGAVEQCPLHAKPVSMYDGASVLHIGYTHVGDRFVTLTEIAVLSFCCCYLSPPCVLSTSPCSPPPVSLHLRLLDCLRAVLRSQRLSAIAFVVNPKSKLYIHTLLSLFQQFTSKTQGLLPSSC